MPTICGVVLSHRFSPFEGLSALPQRGGVSLSSAGLFHFPFFGFAAFLKALENRTFAPENQG